MDTRLITLRKLYPLIMGALTLVVLLFYPPYSWGIMRFSGTYWELRGFYPEGFASFSQMSFLTNAFNMFVLCFPLLALVACVIWLWRSWINRNPLLLSALGIVPGAALLAIVGIAVIFVVVYLLMSRGNSMAIAFALANTWLAFQVFLGALPFLLLVAVFLVIVQQKFR